MKLDILITPTAPFTAPLIHQSQHLVHQLSFSCFQNILELPAGNIPVRLVLKEETKYPTGTFYEKEVAESIVQSEGLPVCIQFTGEHLKDEECVAAMWQMANLLGHSHKQLSDILPVNRWRQ